MKVVGCGISGLIGRHLVRVLAKKYELVRLRRSASGVKGAEFGREVLWAPGEPGEWVKEIDGAYGVINLCGESIVDKRWTRKRKRELRESRVLTTRAIVEAIAEAKIKPKVLVNASAIGFYGDRENIIVNEESHAGAGFLAELCKEWEGEAQKASAFGVRVVCVRTGIVLAKEGGALAKMTLPFKLFIGGPLGSGKQVMSWVHIEDEVGAILKSLEDTALWGPVNLTAPHPVTMREFAHTLGRVMKRPSLFLVPGFVLRILLGEMSEMLLTGQNVAPLKLMGSGYKFKFETLEPALKDLGSGS